MKRPFEGFKSNRVWIKLSLGCHSEERSDEESRCIG
jgi:hypothetical protein